MRFARTVEQVEINDANHFSGSMSAYFIDPNRRVYDRRIANLFKFQSVDASGSPEHGMQDAI